MEEISKLESLKLLNLKYIDEHTLVVIFGKYFQILSTRESEIKIINCNIEEDAHKDSIRDTDFNFKSNLFVTASEDKFIKIWDMNTWKCLGSLEHKKKVSSVLFSEDGTQVIISDKFGYVYWAPSDLSQPFVFLMGHCGMITDMKLSNDFTYLATADRDEKIRISNYPDAFDIQSFCLGHKEFISSIQFLSWDSNLLISGGGDSLMNLWNWKDGINLATHKFLDGSEQNKIVKIWPNASSEEIIATSLEDGNQLYLFSLKVENNETTFSQFQILELPTAVVSCTFDHNGNCLVSLGLNSQSLLQVYSKSNSNLYEINTDQDFPLLKFINENCSKEVPQTEVEQNLNSIKMSQFRKHATDRDNFPEKKDKENPKKKQKIEHTNE